MKKFLFTVSVYCILFFTFLYQANAGPNDAVSIPDAALRTAIETKLGKSSGDTITESEMNGMTGSLKVNYVSVSDLTGLEHATGITELGISNNRGEITNLSPLADLTQLTILSIHNYKTLNDPPTALSDISPVTKLTNLETLRLDNSSIVDISPLMGLTKLKTLGLERNSIVDTSSLASLTALKTLDLKSNKLTSLGTSLSSLTALTQLWLGDNKDLSNISAVASLTNLETLHLTATSITSAGLSAVLPSLSKLKWLHIDQTPISDLSVLGKLPVVLTEVLDIGAMSSDPNRGWTFLRGNGQGLGWLLTDLSPLVSLMNAGKVITMNTRQVDLRYNWSLDYESLYTHIPALIAAGISDVKYTVGIPALERVSAENYVGRPRTRHTFVVRASNTSFNNYKNDRFAKVPVTFTIIAPDGSTDTKTVVTGNDGVARVSIILGNAGQTHTVDAVVPAKTTSVADLQHDELSVRFTATADNKAPIAPDPTLSGLTVTFEDYPEDQPIDEFGIIIKFSEPITEFQMEDIIIETKLATGTGAAALKELAPLIQPTRICPARIGLPADATGTVRLIVRAGAALTPLGQIGPVTNTASEFIEFGHAYDADIRYRPPPALVVTKIDFAKGMFWIQNTTQYRFNVEMRIYSEDHWDKYFKVSDRALIPIEDAETLAFSLTPPETDDASIKHLNSELLLSQNQNQPLKLSSQKFCIKLIRVITVDTASNMNEDFRVKDTRWAPPGDVIFRQYNEAWDLKLKGLRRDHLAYYRFPLDGKLADSWNVEESVPAAPSKSSRQLRVVLSQFRSEHTESGVIVEWTTASELENAGFYVLRSRSRKSGFVRVSPSLIVGAGTTAEQNTYTYQDTTAEANVPYYYRLEEVSLSGNRRTLATVRLRGHLSAANKLLWKWADVKTAD